MDDSGVENLTDAVLSLAVAPLGKARDTSINRGPRPNGIRALFAISELHSCTQLQHTHTGFSLVSSSFFLLSLQQTP